MLINGSPSGFFQSPRGVRENRVENDTLFLGEANKEQPLYVKLGGFSSILRKCLDGEM
ncbi:hypothetical protein AAG906_015413 [Vitis piasezkii]|uniref:Uncharacterized protein n=1 Tax=Vitis vinifera TaxID=29760 RepID=A0A438H9V7_VITVI|nr:hypothetical protein CK203_041053 [Vitis vinifera]